VRPFWNKGFYQRYAQCQSGRSRFNYFVFNNVESQPPTTFPKHPYIETHAPPPATSAAAASAPSSQIKHQSLIERYNLTAAARAQEKGKARAADESITDNAKDSNKAWNADKSAREKTLQDRKAKMILEARQ
jgi:hypothetical protein